MFLKRTLPLAIAISFGLLTLLALLVPVPTLVGLITGWVSLLIAIALLLGVFNLFSVHATRLFQQRNLYSGVLLLSMIGVFAVGITDVLPGLTENGVERVFNWVQAPLEAALASLLAFFLITAGVTMLRRQRSVWAVLFLLSAVLVLATAALANSGLVPAAIQQILQRAQNVVNEIIVTAGMRGLLIGIALGTITLSLRLLLGVERPYHK